MSGPGVLRLGRGLSTSCVDPPPQRSNIASHPHCAGGSAPSLASRWNHLASSAQRSPGPLYLFPLPPDYERALQRRLNLTHDMRSKFKQVGGAGGWLADWLRGALDISGHRELPISWVCSLGFTTPKAR